jgi:hypothetical protein
VTLIGFELVAGKRDRSFADDAPQQVPMRPAPTAIKRNPGTDEKKARKQHARKTAGLSPDDAKFLYQHALDYAKGDAGYAAWYMAEYAGSANGLEDVPDHPDAMAKYQEAVSAQGGDDQQDQQAQPDQQKPQNDNPFAKKESRMTTEADLLAKMAAARTPQEQQGYARDLEALRAQKAAALRAQSSLDLEAAQHVESGREFLLPSEPSHSGLGVTAATDWLADAAAPAGTPLAAVEAQMRAEASVWFDRRHDFVKGDAAELGAQAVGFGRRVASVHGEHAEAAWQAFAAQVEHLHDAHLRRQAMDVVQPPPYSAPVHDYKIPDNPDTFDDSLAVGADPKSTAQTSAAPSLAEGDQPEGDHSETLDNPAATNLGHDKDGKDTSATDYLDGTKTPSSNGKGETFSSLRLTAEGDPKSPAQTGAAPSLTEGDAPEGDHAEPAVVDLLSGDHDRSGGDSAATDSIDGTTYPKQSLRQIAASIAADEARVGRQVHPAARPFLAAMAHLDACTDAFAGVGGREVVSFFLANTALHGPGRDAHLAALQQHLAGEVPEAFKKNWGSGDKDGGDSDQETNSQADSDDDPDASESGDDSDKKPWEKESARTVAMNAADPSGQYFARVNLPADEALKAGQSLVAQAQRALAAEYGGGSPKEGDTAKCHKDGGAIQFFDGQWMHLKGTGDSHNDVYPATPREQAEKDKQASLSPSFAARVQANLR